MKRINVAALALAATLAGSGAPADDTDLYLFPAVPAGSEPMVMFTLDWRPNLGATACTDIRECQGLIDEGYLAAAGPYTFFDVLRAVLQKVLAELEGVKVGFMISHNNQNNCAGPTASGCSNGAYLLMGFKSLTGDAGAETLAELQAKLGAIPVPAGNLSHPFQGKELFFELFRYLTGQGVYNGHNGWTDFGTNNASNINTEFLGRPYAGASWDSSVEHCVALDRGGEACAYRSPLGEGTACAKIYTINLMFQVSNQEDDSDTAIKAARNLGGMGGINLSGNANNFGTVIRYLYEADLADGTYGAQPAIAGRQNITSYFIVDPTKINVTTYGYAVAGGTGAPMALDDDPRVLVETLKNVFKSILSVSTTFVAPAVPVNVFNRAESEDEVFMALFQAEELPFWSGNLKKLKIATVEITNADGTSTTVKELQDALGASAIDADGRIKREALTYWTDGASLPAPNLDDHEVDGRDGRGVARGGAGQRIPGFASDAIGAENDDETRQIFTENAAGNGLLDLDADPDAASALWQSLVARWAPATSASTYASATAAEQTRALNDLRYARGLQDSPSASCRLLRPELPWVLGDPLHSRPRPVNYGARGGHSESNPDIRVLVGSNDGFLHMFRNTRADGGEDGSESWAFMPRAAVATLDRLRSAAGGAPAHPITVDGSPATLVVDQDGDGNLIADEGDTVYAYFGLRRGGKGYYALDVSDPDSPAFLWRRQKGDADFAELGQTWSTPRVGYVRLTAAGERVPVVVFGAGYNGDDTGTLAYTDAGAGKDQANRWTRARIADGIPEASKPVGTDDEEGNALFVVNAETGALIWKAVVGDVQAYDSGRKAYTHPELVDSVPAEVTTLDSNGDGLIDRVYFGDTGGVLWRADLPPAVDDGDPDTADAAPPGWRLTKLLSVGRHAAGEPSALNDRRFFNRPDVVYSRDDLGPFDGVLIGTGDREDPLEAETENWFYLYKDRATHSGSPPDPSLLADDLLDLTELCTGAGACELTDEQRGALANGWRLQLTAPGEKNLAPALTVAGKVFFTTFISPGSLDQSACGLSEGTGRLYVVGLQDARPLFNWDLTNDSDGTPALERFDRLASPGIPVEPVPLGGPLILIQGQEAGQNIVNVEGQFAFRTYWYDHH